MAEAVLFDFDGTIADSSEGIFHTALYTVRQLGVTDEFTEADLRRFVGPPLRQCFVVAFGLDESLLDDALRIYRAEYDKRGRFMMKLYPGMRDVLETIKGMGLRLGTASFKTETLVRQCLEHLGILDLFDTVRGSDLRENRTKSDIINLALNDLIPRRTS